MLRNTIFCDLYLVFRAVNPYHTAFPDIECTVEDMIAAGDKVVTRWTMQGTLEGVFMRIPPTSKRVQLSGISINCFANGRSVESWEEADVIGMMK